MIPPKTPTQSVGPETIKAMREAFRGNTFAEEAFDRMVAYMSVLEREHREMREALIEVADIKQYKRAIEPQQILQDDGDHCSQIAHNALSFLSL